MLQHYSIIALIIAVVLALMYFLLGKYRLAWIGRIVGMALGYVLAHAPGTLIGFFLGQVYDNLAAAPKRRAKPRAQQQQAPVRQFVPTSVDDIIYFDTLFSVLGHFAAASKKVLSPYLNELHQVMQRMQLNESVQRAAWEWFQQGQHADFNVRQALFGFTRHCVAHADYGKTLLAVLIEFAQVHPPINDAQYNLLSTVAHTLHLPVTEFAHLAPKSHHQAGSEQKAAGTENTSSLQQAYRMLDLEPLATPAEIKWAYRRLMSRYHPDRLMSKDLPDEFIQLATRRTQEIKAAYVKICADRGMKK